MSKGLPLITMVVGSLMSFLALFALSSAFMVSINPPSNKRGEVSYRIHQRRSSCSHLQAKKKKKGPASDALAQLEALEALEVIEVEGQSIFSVFSCLSADGVVRRSRSSRSLSRCSP